MAIMIVWTICEIHNFLLRIVSLILLRNKILNWLQKELELIQHKRRERETYSTQGVRGCILLGVQSISALLMLVAEPLSLVSPSSSVASPSSSPNFFLYCKVSCSMLWSIQKPISTKWQKSGMKNVLIISGLVPGTNVMASRMWSAGLVYWGQGNPAAGQGLIKWRHKKTERVKHTLIEIENLWTGALVDDVALVEDDEFVKEVEDLGLGLMDSTDDSAWAWGSEILQRLAQRQGWGWIQSILSSILALQVSNNKVKWECLPWCGFIEKEDVGTEKELNTDTHSLPLTTRNTSPQLITDDGVSAVAKSQFCYRLLHSLLSFFVGEGCRKSQSGSVLKRSLLIARKWRREKEKEGEAAQGREKRKRWWISIPVKSRRL